MTKAPLSVSLLLLTIASTGSAQLISIRTVPISQEHQFAIFPTQNVGMGGISVALADSLLDPFNNPAKAARVHSTRFFGAPSTYTVTSRAGAGRTLPVGTLARAGEWYGGLYAAIQQVDPSRQQQQFFPLPLASCAACTTSPIKLQPNDRTQGNTYAFALAGRQLRNGVSLGGSMLWSQMHAIDGVDLLYAGSTRVDQLAHAFDLRFGLLKEFSAERSLEAVVLHNRFGAADDVAYLDSFWDPGLQQFAQRPRLDHNLDRTRTWGVHVAYQQPLSSDGWRGGALLTANRMSHPKIPNYVIQSVQVIPRDPGYSSAFNIGFGLARELARSSLGFDLIYEPIWSHTWADAASPTANSLGQPIPKGGMTIENHFRFNNVISRMGLDERLSLGNAGPQAGLQLGLALHNIHYNLDQQDHIAISSRSHREGWTEWTPTWGFNLNFPELSIRYHGSVTHGTGRPGIQSSVCCVAIESPTALDGSTNILAAPSGPLTLTDVAVWTHQISISLPIH